MQFVPCAKLRAERAKKARIPLSSEKVRSLHYSQLIDNRLAAHVYILTYVIGYFNPLF